MENVCSNSSACLLGSTGLFYDNRRYIDELSEKVYYVSLFSEKICAWRDAVSHMGNGDDAYL